MTAQLFAHRGTASSEESSRLLMKKPVLTMPSPSNSMAWYVSCPFIRFYMLNYLKSRSETEDDMPDNHPSRHGKQPRVEPYSDEETGAGGVDRGDVHMEENGQNHTQRQRQHRGVCFISVPTALWRSPSARADPGLRLIF
jgi:hypothetical protein